MSWDPEQAFTVVGGWAKRAAMSGFKPQIWGLARLHQVFQVMHDARVHTVLEHHISASGMWLLKSLAGCLHGHTKFGLPLTL